MDGTGPNFEGLQLCPWIPITPEKPNLTRRRPESSNWQYNSPVGQTNFLEPGILSTIGQVTQPNWSVPEEFIATQTGLGQFSSINTWREGSSSNVYGTGFAVDDKFTLHDGGGWNNMSFGSLLAMAHSIPPNVAPNVVVEADSSATNLTFGTLFRPLVAASQRTLTFENSLVSNVERNILSNGAPNALMQVDSAATNFTFGTQYPHVAASQRTQCTLTFKNSLVSNVARNTQSNGAPNGLIQVDSAATNFTFGTQYPHVAATQRTQRTLTFENSSVSNVARNTQSNGAPNGLMQVDSAATNFTFGTQFPHVAASQRTLTFENSSVSNVARNIQSNGEPNGLMQVDSAATNFTFGTQFPHVAASQRTLTFENSSVSNVARNIQSNGEPNGLMQVDSAATNFTFGTQFPHVAASQCMLNFENASVPNLDSLLEDNGMCHMLGASRPLFDLNAPCTTVTEDAALHKSNSVQFEPVTPYKNNKAEYRQDGPDIQTCSPDGKKSARDAQKKKIMDEKKQSVVDQLPRRVHENHKPDKGGPNVADLSKTPQQQKPRRRKHRPKVVIEGQVKATPKPRGTVPSASQETIVRRKYVRRKAAISSFEKQKNEDGSDIEDSDSDFNDIPTRKRRYTRRKLINEPESTMDKQFSVPTHISTNRLTRNSCRRSLNFNLEPESENFDPTVDKAKGVNSTHGIEVMELNLNEMAVPYDLTSSMKQTPEGYLPRPDKGKCKIVFSDVTHDKEVNIIQLTGNSDKQWTPPNNSICSNLTRETERGLKRQHSEVEASSSNATERYYSFMETHLSMFSTNDCASGMLFPIIHKKKRTQKSHVRTSRSSVADRATSLLMNNHVADGTECGSQVFEDLLDFEPTASVKRKRSKGCTRVRNYASLQELCKKLPAFPSEATKASQSKRGIGALNVPLTCMEALVANTCSTIMTKRRSKRTFVLNTRVQNSFNHQQEFATSAGPPLALKWRSLSEIDLLTDQFKLLGLNAVRVSAQMQLALMHNPMNYEQRHALVPYQRGGAIVPFDGSSGQAQRKPARPRVDLDDETTRVWKLLLEDINSEGVDGTDDEKTKWWEEERRVFKGRADSFIARMHLIQGDRRFSPWKGSVVDSVVGVFLTQNVSDHLSSSAFITLAAHFPPTSNTSTAECFEEKVCSEARQPEASDLDTDETTTSNIKVLYEQVSSSDCQMLHDLDDDEIIDNLSCQLPDRGNTDSVPFHESVPNKSTSLIGGVLEQEYIHCSQIPAISSQNSADSPDAQTSEITGSCSHSNSKEEPANSFASSTDFVKLLQMAGTVLHGGYGKDGGDIDLDENQKVQSGSLALESENLQHFVLSTESTYETGVKDASNGNKIQMKQSLVEKHTAEMEAQCLLQDGGHEKQEIAVAEIRPHHLIDSSGSSNNVGNSRKSDHKEVSSNKTDPDYQPGKTKRKGGRIRKGKKHPIDWDSLRNKAEEGGRKRERTANTMDSVDWDAVRCANVDEIAEVIKERGMNNMLAERIKDFLNRLVKHHGSIDLEWLRDVPPDKAKEYLLSFRGLGLKSVECVRLLTLHHLAFPVDTNVGRIAVRLGWVPLQPLPESLQLHLLEMYPILESIQKYLWPRLCKLDQRTLYELHYQMITFGKVFCTKSKPNCNACPMRGECRHFASAFASARLALPAPEEKSIVATGGNQATDQDPMRGMNTLQFPAPLPVPAEKRIITTEEQATSENLQFYSCQPIIDEPATPEPIIELPATPEPEYDIENAFDEDPDEIPTIHFNMQQFTQNLHDVMQNTEGDMSKALIALTAEAASIPVPKLKNVSRLRTEHQVYELSDSHPLLEGMDKREPDDPSPYLLAIWTPGETVHSTEPPERRCGSQGLGVLCTNETCSSCNSVREQNSQTVRGTLLIPCRTAMRGSFPLNGTYFQVNEVFSDHESSLNPIDVPRKWLWNLPRRTVYFGTSVTSIFRGLTTAGVQHCFWRGFICVRGFDRKMRAPRPVIARLHFPISKTKGKGKADYEDD